MFRKLLCWLARKLKKYEWHEWKQCNEVVSEYEPSLVHFCEECPHCGLVRWGTRERKNDTQNNLRITDE